MHFEMQVFATIVSYVCRLQCICYKQVMIVICNLQVNYNEKKLEINNFGPISGGDNIVKIQL
jgi:hypothetical protein